MKDGRETQVDETKAKPRSTRITKRHETFDEASKTLKTPNRCGGFACSCNIGLLMDQYPRQYLYLRAVRAKLFIDANFASDIDLNKIADEACFSKFHFVRLFKDIYGRTPHQYLTHVRIKKAKEHLDEGQTVAYACFKVGFDSISSFTGLFKRRTGQTPRQYQLARESFRESVANDPLNHIPGCFVEKAGLSEPGAVATG